MTSSPPTADPPRLADIYRALLDRSGRGGLIEPILNHLANGTSLRDLMLSIVDASAPRLEARLANAHFSQLREAIAGQPPGASVVVQFLDVVPGIAARAEQFGDSIPAGAILTRLVAGEDDMFLPLDLAGRRIIVYLDTAFYVRLARLDDPTAERVIARLNRLRVRPVISDAILRELLSSADRPDSDRRLVDRLRALAEPPFRLRSDLSWDALLMDGQTRQNFAEILRAIDDLLVVAESLATTSAAGIKTQGDREAVRAIAQRFGLADASGSVSPEACWGLVRAVLGNLSRALPKGEMRDRMESIVEAISSSPSPAAATAIAERLKGLLAPQELAAVQEGRQLAASATANDSRPRDVATGTATPKVQAKLAHTFRDSEHMRLFVQHAAAIELLQVDGPQLNLIHKPSPKHRLASLGLVDRCFAAPSPEAVAEALEAYSERTAKKLLAVPTSPMDPAHPEGIANKS